MTETIDKVHVIFKTHLDVGFTDYAHKVVQRYFDEFMPQAIQLARTLAEDAPDAPFRWTVGSWLPYEYLQRATDEQRDQMVNAIESGYLRWHALPFTTHTELMDAALFRAGLSLSQELDRRFGVKTISAKMTDVPGHTRAMIPLLAEAGVRLLHIGVNPAATVPDVPPVFVWRDAASGADVICMYQQVYGDTMILPGTREAVSLVFTGDNLGPPSKQSVVETFALLRHEFPDAEFVGATLDDVANILLPLIDTLPVVTAEIGDTWIQGVGSDPTKTSQYRALLRQREEWRRKSLITPEQLTEFERKLLLIPEHTWGMDLKTHLQDYEHYTTNALAQVRDTPRFKAFEQSWHEQRQYVDTAVASLEGTPAHDLAQQSLAAIRPVRPDLTAFTETGATEFDAAHWSVAVDAQTGAITGLKAKDRNVTLADASHPLGLFQYETFSTADYDRYWKQYIRDREHGHIRIWAHPDNVKPGLDVAEHIVWQPHVKHMYQRQTDNDLTLLVEVGFSEKAHVIGAPDTAFLQYDFPADGTVHVALQWFDKPACRLPEAFWMSFNPALADPTQWQMRKLGQWISPLEVINRGGRTLHATDYGLKCANEGVTLDIESLDAALVAPGRPSLLDFHNEPPDLAQGMHFNLYNNVWGTNFTMWFDDDALFRFVISAALA
jgi:hypothetical protein